MGNYIFSSVYLKQATNESKKGSIYTTGIMALSWKLLIY